MVQAGRAHRGSSGSSSLLNKGIPKANGTGLCPDSSGISPVREDSTPTRGKNLHTQGLVAQGGYWLTACWALPWTGAGHVPHSKTQGLEYSLCLDSEGLAVT